MTTTTNICLDKPDGLCTDIHYTCTPSRSSLHFLPAWQNNSFKCCI